MDDDDNNAAGVITNNHHHQPSSSTISAAVAAGPSSSLLLHQADRISSLLEEHLDRASEIPKNMISSSSASVLPGVVRFTVGNEPFSIALSTLQQEPTSLLFRLAVQRYCNNKRNKQQILPSMSSSSTASKRCREEDAYDDDNDVERGSSSKTRVRSRRGLTRQNENASDYDDDDSIIIDRDPYIFRHVLNLLRGYHSQIEASRRDDLLNDAEFYGVMKSYRTRYLPHLESRFSPAAAGSYDNGKRLTSARHIVTVLDKSPGYIKKGEGSIDMKMRIELMDGDKGVLIGIVSRNHLKNFASDCSTTKNCAMLYPNGDLVHTFSTRSPLSSSSLQNSSESTVVNSASPSSHHLGAALAEMITNSDDAPGLLHVTSSTISVVTPTIEEGTIGIAAGRAVRVVLDMNKMKVYWITTKEDEIIGEITCKVLKLPENEDLGELALAVVLSKNSQVHIVDC